MDNLIGVNEDCWDEIARIPCAVPWDKYRLFVFVDPQDDCLEVKFAENQRKTRIALRRDILLILIIA